MRRIILDLFVAAVILLTAQSVMAQHQWYNGRVTDMKTGIINVDNKEYEISPNVKVVQHVKGKASINEESARLDNVLTGQRVTVKIDGGFVTEIIIERYH